MIRLVMRVRNGETVRNKLAQKKAMGKLPRLMGDATRNNIGKVSAVTDRNIGNM